MSLASAFRPRRAPGKSMMSGSEKRLKRKGSTASSVSGPPSWKSTTPMRRVEIAIPLGSLQRNDVISIGNRRSMVANAIERGGRNLQNSVDRGNRIARDVGGEN